MRTYLAAAMAIPTAVASASFVTELDSGTATPASVMMNASVLGDELSAESLTQNFSGFATATEFTVEQFRLLFDPLSLAAPAIGDWVLVGMSATVTPTSGSIPTNGGSFMIPVEVRLDSGIIFAFTTSTFEIIDLENNPIVTQGTWDGTSSVGAGGLELAGSVSFSADFTSQGWSTTGSWSVPINLTIPAPASAGLAAAAALFAVRRRR